MMAANYRRSQAVEHGTILGYHLKMITDDGKGPQVIAHDCFGKLHLFGQIGTGCKPFCLFAIVETLLNMYIY